MYYSYSITSSTHCLSDLHCYTLCTTATVQQAAHIACQIYTATRYVLQLQYNKQHALLVRPTLLHAMYYSYNITNSTHCLSDLHYYTLCTTATVQQAACIACQTYTATHYVLQLQYNKQHALLVRPTLLHAM